MSIVLKGMSASRGFSIGYAKVVKKNAYIQNGKRIFLSDIEFEKMSVTKAIKIYCTEIENYKTNDLKGEILKTHLEFLSDPFLTEQIFEKIENRLLSSVDAVHSTIIEMAESIENLDDKYLSERALDYRDIGNNLINILNNNGCSDLKFNKDTKKDDEDKYLDRFIIVTDELTPTDVSTCDRKTTTGFISEAGGITSHTAILSQSMGVPFVVAIEKLTSKINDGDLLILDGTNGKVIVNPSMEEENEYINKIKEIEKRRMAFSKTNNPVTTSDGKRILVSCNIDSVDDIETALTNGAESIGLFRTEFLYMKHKKFPSEDEQFDVYVEALKKLDGKSLVIRTLDIGGDKELSYLDLKEEKNPFLGWRAIRMSLDRPDIFKTQLRAVLRASNYGNIKLLFPMIISVEELLKVREIISEAELELKSENISFNKVPFGVMIETPAAALMSEKLIKYCDFFSIGTNDLTQYTLAVDRGNEKISHLFDSFNPAVLKLIKLTIDSAHKYNKPVSLCGKIASNEMAVNLLIGLGLDSFSSSVSCVSDIRMKVSETDSVYAEMEAQRMLKCETLSEVYKIMENER